MKLSNHKKFLLVLLSVIFLPGLTVGLNPIHYFTQNNIPELSDEYDITVNSPMPPPTSYDGPMEGYYPSTFGFENSVYTYENWDFVEGAGAIDIVDQVTDSYTMHRGVLHLYDGYSSQHVSASHDIEVPTEYGLIDFWLKLKPDIDDSVTPPVVGIEKATIKLYGANDVQVEIKMENNWISYKTYTGQFVNVMPYVDGLWYHFGILFGELAEWQSGDRYGYMLFINNNPDLDGDGEMDKHRYVTALNQVNINKIEFSTGDNEYLHSLYIDAVGFQWYPDYNEQDNLIEGILIDFDPPMGIDFEETYYILDSVESTMNSRYTMVIPMIGGGVHTLQIKGVVDSTDYFSDPNYTFEIEEVLDWGVDAINAERVWGGFEDAKNIAGDNPAGQGVNMLVVDKSGFQYNHEDLNWIGGYDFTGEDPLPEPIPPDPEKIPEHGTHCAGIIAALDSGDGKGLLGVAPKVNLFLLKSGTLSDAIDWALDQHPEVDNPYFETYGKMDIISYSMGGSAPDESKCELAKNEGIIIVASAGNSGLPPLELPARFESTLGVGSITHRYGEYTRSSFSTYGQNLDLVAPGYKIFSTVLNDKYSSLTGTSQACPMVAGTCALIMSASNYIKGLQKVARFEAIKEVLTKSAIKVGGVSYNSEGWHEEYGYGMVDAEAAVDYAQNMESIEITSPNDGSAFVRGVDITFEAKGFDKDGISDVKYRIGSEPWQSATYDQNTNRYKWTWSNTWDYDDGTYRIECELTDGTDQIYDLIQVTLYSDKEVAYQYINILGTTFVGSLASTYADDGDVLVIKQQFMGGWWFWQTWKSETEFRFDYSEYWFYDNLKVDIINPYGTVKMYVYFPGGYEVYTDPGETTIDWPVDRPIQKIVVTHTYTGLYVRYCYINYIWIELARLF